MMARFYNPNADYPMVCEWRKGHGKQPVEQRFLPPIGLIAELDNQAIAAGWLIKTDAGVGLLEHGVSNPTAPKRSIYQATRMITEQLSLIAAEMGLSQVWGVVCNRGLSRMYRESGFIQQDKKFDVFVGVL